jgi:hypothetical protein
MIISSVDITGQNKKEYNVDIKDSFFLDNLEESLYQFIGAMKI